MLNVLAIYEVIICQSAADGYYGSYYSGAIVDGYGRGGGIFSGKAALAGGVIPAAVISRHTVGFRDVESQYHPISPQIIEVGAGILVLTMIFKSASSRINVIQKHEGSGGGEESTSTEDESYRLYHSVTIPIIQEVREIITPYRRVIQEIQPVQEDVQTIVSRGVPRGTSVGYGFYGGTVGTGLRGGYGARTRIYGTGKRDKPGVSYSNVGVNGKSIKLIKIKLV